MNVQCVASCKQFHVAGSHEDFATADYPHTDEAVDETTLRYRVNEANDYRQMYLHRAQTARRNADDDDRRAKKLAAELKVMRRIAARRKSTCQLPKAERESKQNYGK